MTRSDKISDSEQLGAPWRASPTASVRIAKCEFDWPAVAASAAPAGPCPRGGTESPRALGLQEARCPTVLDRPVHSRMTGAANASAPPCSDNTPLQALLHATCSHTPSAMSAGLPLGVAVKAWLAGQLPALPAEVC